MLKKLIRFFDRLFVECTTSPSGKHEWAEPRLEDNIDEPREVTEPYCRYCFTRLLAWSQYRFPPQC